MPSESKILYIKVKTLSFWVGIIGIIFAGLLFVLFHSLEDQDQKGVGMMLTTIKSIMDASMISAIFWEKPTEIRFWLRISVILTIIVAAIPLSSVSVVFIVAIINVAALNLGGLWIVFFYTSLLLENAQRL